MDTRQAVRIQLAAETLLATLEESAGGWSEREAELLSAPATELPYRAGHSECVALFESAVKRCRDAAERLPATERTELPYGGSIPRELSPLLEELRGGNLPVLEDRLGVEVVRQAFLSSRAPIAPGIPALQGYSSSNGALLLEGVTIPAQRSGQRSRTTLYLVVHEGRKQRRIHREVKKLGTWCRSTKHSWIVETALTPGELEALLAAVAKREKVLVAALAGGRDQVAQRNLTPRVRSWIERRVHRSIRG